MCDSICGEAGAKYRKRIGPVGIAMQYTEKLPQTTAAAAAAAVVSVCIKIARVCRDRLPAGGRARRVYRLAICMVPLSYRSFTLCT